MTIAQLIETLQKNYDPNELIVAEWVVREDLELEVGGPISDKAFKNIYESYLDKNYSFGLEEDLADRYNNLNETEK